MPNFDAAVNRFGDGAFERVRNTGSIVAEEGLNGLPALKTPGYRPSSQ
jgi:hypothetical protein